MKLGRLVPILIPAGLGLLTQVAAVWSFAMVADLHTFRGQYRTDARDWRTPRYLAHVLPPAASGRQMPGRLWGYRLISTEFVIPGPNPSRPGGWFTIWSSEFGWPFYALRWDELNFRPMNDDLTRERIAAVQEAWRERAGWNEGVEVPWIRTPTGHARRIPVSPIWGGLAADVALAGLLFWAALFGPGVLRRVLRRRRGACERCGYDMRGLEGCPECGAVGAVGAVGNGGGGDGGGGRTA